MTACPVSAENNTRGPLGHPCCSLPNAPAHQFLALYPVARGHCASIALRNVSNLKPPGHRPPRAGGQPAPGPPAALFQAGPTRQYRDRCHPAHDFIAHVRRMSKSSPFRLIRIGAPPLKSIPPTGGGHSLDIRPGISASADLVLSRSAQCCGDGRLLRPAWRSPRPFRAAARTCRRCCLNKPTWFPARDLLHMLRLSATPLPSPQGGTVREINRDRKLTAVH